MPPAPRMAGLGGREHVVAPVSAGRALYREITPQAIRLPELPAGSLW